MKTQLACPCTVIIRGADEDDLVERVLAHLASTHPDRTYTRAEILMFAY